MPNPEVRPAHLHDADEIAKMSELLWPDAPADEHRKEIADLLTSGHYGSLPAAIFVAHDDTGNLTGFLQIGLRSHADGCDPIHPVGFIEGWFVYESFRRQGIGRALMRIAEQWAREQGCIEMASDTWIDHTLSQNAHQSLGDGYFESHQSNFYS